MKSAFYSIIFFLLWAPAIFASGNIKFQRTLSQKPIKDVETGETYLDIALEVEVKTAGDYALVIRFGQPKNGVAYSSVHALTPGTQTIHGVCYGDSVWLDKIDLSTAVFESRLWRDDYLETAEDSTRVELNGSWKDFKRAIAVPNAKLDMKEIVAKIGRSRSEEQERWNPAAFKEDIAVDDLSSWFGKPVASDKYVVYRYRSDRLRDGVAYIAAAKDKSEAFPIWDDETFNRLAKTLTFKIENIDDALKIAEFYLQVGTRRARLKIPRAVDEDTREKRKGKPDLRFAEWFKSRPEKRFRAPSFERENDACLLEFFSWQPKSGVIRHHKMAFAPDNRLLSSDEEEVGIAFERWVR